MEAMLGCVPIKDAASVGFTPYKGSIVGHCSQCDCEVWVGPEQQKKHEEGFKIVCLVCVLRAMKPGDGFGIVPLSKKKMGD